MTDDRLVDNWRWIWYGKDLFYDLNMESPNESKIRSKLYELAEKLIGIQRPGNPALVTGVPGGNLQIIVAGPGYDLGCGDYACEYYLFKMSPNCEVLQGCYVSANGDEKMLTEAGSIAFLKTLFEPKFVGRVNLEVQVSDKLTAMRRYIIQEIGAWKKKSTILDPLPGDTEDVLEMKEYIRSKPKYRRLVEILNMIAVGGNRLDVEIFWHGNREVCRVVVGSACFIMNNEDGYFTYETHLHLGEGGKVPHAGKYMLRNDLPGILSQLGMLKR